MLPLKLNLIAAVARGGIIGASGHLPWRLPDDLEYFYRKTAGGTCLIGRRAFAEMPKTKFLAGRQVIVLTRDTTFAHPGVRVAHSREQALDWARSLGGSAWVCGGAEIYRLFWPEVVRLYLTEVAADVPGDAWLPAVSPAEWAAELRLPHAADSRHAYAFDFAVYARKMPSNS